jgi:hypothetical protein
MAGWAAAGLLLAAALAANALAGHAIRVRSVDADTLWAFAFMKDVLADGGRVGDWDFGRHSDSFPDWLVMAGAYAAARRPAGFLLAYGALNSLVLLAVAWRILFLHRRAACGPRRAAELSFLMALPVVLLPLAARSWGLFEPFVGAIDFPSWHFNAYLAAMLGAILAVDAFERPLSRVAVRLIPAFLLLSACGFSDRLALLSALLPFPVAALYFAAVARPLRPGLAVAAATVGGAALLVVLGHDALWRHLARVDGIVQGLQPAGALGHAKVLLRALFPPEAHAQWPLSALLIGAILAVARRLLLHLGRRLSGATPAGRPEDANAILAYLLAMVLTQPVAMLAFGEPVVLEQIRYIYPAFFAGLLAVAARLGQAIPVGWPAGRVRLLAALAGLAALLVPLPASLPVAIPPPPLVRCLERLAETHAMAVGLGFHWDTYPVTLLAARPIRVLSIDSDGSIRHWGDNLTWFAPDPGRPPFSFVVLSADLDEAAVRARYGAPDAVLDCAALGPGFGSQRILWYDAAGAARVTAAVTAQYLAWRR